MSPHEACHPDMPEPGNENPVPLPASFRGGRNQTGLREPGVTLKNRDNCSILQLSHLFFLLFCAWPSVVMFVAFQPLSPLCQVPEFRGEVPVSG
jgi:hypothetical protein